MKAKQQAAQTQFSSVHGKHKSSAPAQVKREIARLTKKGK